MEAAVRQRTKAEGASLRRIYHLVSDFTTNLLWESWKSEGRHEDDKSFHGATEQRGHRLWLRRQDTSWLKGDHQEGQQFPSVAFSRTPTGQKRMIFQFCFNVK